MVGQVCLFVFLLQILKHVNSDPVLFEQGFMRFARHDHRQAYFNVEHIDNKIIGNNKELIIVKSKWLPTLHSQAIRNLNNLQQIVLVKCRIQNIEKNAFFNLPNLTTIRLHDNEISEIMYGIFNGLSVKVITLQRNGIKKIEGQAFDDMPNLYKIHLNANKLKTWDSGWFKNSPKLTEIYFRRNHIEYIPPNAFAHLKDDTKLYLSKNRLGKLNAESFYGLEKLSQLYLDRNNITEISTDVFRDLTEVDVIFLARNKITKINEMAFPKIKKVGFLDLSSNLLQCLPYRLVTVANVTNLEKNNGTCQCILDFKKQLQQARKNNEIAYDEATCD